MASKDQRRGHQAIEDKVHQTRTPIRMDRQCCARTQERWEGMTVRGLLGFEQRLS